MKKTHITIITLLIIIAAGVLTYISTTKITEVTGDIPPITTIITDPHDAKYTINEEEIVLVNGVSYTKIPGATATTTTTYFGNDITGDFNQDGTQDLAFLVTQTNGGSGTFYYLVAKLNKVAGAVGSYGVLLGDRIAPQSTTLGTNNTIVVNYADRKPGEPFTTKPSVGKSIILKFDPMTNQFGEVVKDFEGEANPSTMKLDMKAWTWMQTTYSAGTAFVPKNTGKFILTFEKNRFSSKTDCNGVGGEYTIKGNKMTLSKMMSTLMFCEGSQEAEYGKMLADVISYDFTSRGELLLNLKDGGVMLYK